MKLQVKQVKAHFRVVGGAVDDHVASVVGHRQVVLGKGRLAWEIQVKKLIWTLASSYLRRRRSDNPEHKLRARQKRRYWQEESWVETFHVRISCKTNKHTWRGSCRLRRPTSHACSPPSTCQTRRTRWGRKTKEQSHDYKIETSQPWRQCLAWSWSRG